MAKKSAESKKASSSKTKKPNKSGRVKKVLQKEVDLPISASKNKDNKFLHKKRRIRMPQYFRDSWQELKKVTWPTRKETLKLSLAVILFTGFFALFVALADYGFNRLVERVFL